MKFAHKLVLAIVTILAVSFSAIGYLAVSRNFDVALNGVISDNTRQHLFERYSLESEMLTALQRNEGYPDDTLREQAEALAGYIGDAGAWQALYTADGTAVYATLPDEMDAYAKANLLPPQETGYIFYRQNGIRIMLVASQIQNEAAPLTLVSAYDISGVYAERERQLRDMLWMYGLVLLAAIIAVSAASYKLTKPIGKLNRTSKKIARGAYEARTKIVTDDEIGELGSNFNTMAVAVQARIEQLNLSVRQREDFVSAFTHEVKTPMTAIIGYSDILRFQQTNPELQQRAAHFIYREANRLEALSQKLLLLMGLSDEQVDMGPVALDVLFRDATRTIFPVLQDKGVCVHADAAENINVMADRDLMVDLLRNLLLNAIKAAPKDNAVWLQWKDCGDRVEIRVADKGCGMAADELARITEPFYMVDKSRARREGGSGVGLALCRRIVDLHGSTLNFQSAAGKGTVVTFTLYRACR